MRSRAVLLALTLVPVMALAAPSQDARRNTIIEASKKLDRMLHSKWRGAKIQVAQEADDYEFVRRAYLDLTGSTPTLEEIEAYVTDVSETKPFHLIDRLVAGKRFARYWAEKLTNDFFGYADGRYARRAWMYDWMHDAVSKKMPYNIMVQRLIGAEGNGFDNRATNFILKWLDNRERQEITNRVSKLFIGVKISCAACHDHPFAKWKREHFYQLSTFFYRSKWVESGGDEKMMGGKAWEIQDDYSGARMSVYGAPGLRAPVSPTFLNGLRPRNDNLRRELGYLLTNDPQFVRASANRIWAAFFHRGIVDPPDDFSKRNAPSIPELLSTLLKLFVEYKFDVRTLVRVICYTKAYRLSSQWPENEGKKEKAALSVFGVRPLRVLTPSQIFDTIVASTRLDRVTKYKEKPGQLRKLRTEFLKYIGPNYEDEFAPHGEMNLSMQQIIRLITWKELYLGLKPGEDGIVAYAIKKGRKPGQRVRLLYLSLLGRQPTSEQLATAKEFLKGKGDEGYEKLAFALVQTHEYFFTH